MIGLSRIAAQGVPCFSGSCSEIYLEKAFPPEWRPQERLPVARELGETSLMFLVHPTLNEEDIRRHLRGSSRSYDGGDSPSSSRVSL